MREIVDRDPQTINKKGRVSSAGDTYVRKCCSIFNNKTLLPRAAGAGNIPHQRPLPASAV